MASGYGRGLAVKIFSLQKRTGGGVPGDVMRSARLIMEGRGTKADADVCSQYLGVRRSDRRAIQSATRMARNGVNTLNQLTQFSEMAGNGQAAGVIGLASMGANALVDITKNPAFQRAIEDISIKFFNSPAGGARLAYALKRTASNAAAALPLIGIAAEAADLGGNFGRTVLGTKGDSVALKAAQRTAFLSQFDPSKNAQERSLAIRRAAAESIENTNRGNLFSFGADYARKKIGADSKSLNKLEAKILARKAGGGGEALYKAARKQAENDNWSIFGASEDKLDKDTLANIKQRLSDANDMREGAMKAMDNANIALANAMIQEANKAIPNFIVWSAPELFKQRENAHAADRTWSRTQCARAGSRTGD